MKEIGGYIEFEYYHGSMLHENGLLLNCGRNCLAYLIRAKRIRALVMPYFMCDSVLDLCRKYGVKLRFYHVGLDFRPEKVELQSDEWLYLTNYYGQLTREDILCWKQRCDRLIVDNAQAYFDAPVPGVDTIYTCRKFFGVPDGAVLYTDTLPEDALPPSLSMEHMDFLLGRFERGASEFYAQNQDNNRRFADTPVLAMSALTENLLHSFDYEAIKAKRTENYQYLHRHLAKKNLLSLRDVQGAFAYPFLADNGDALRRELIRNRIFVPTLWPNVVRDTAPDSTEYRLAADLLPLPCDQRYGVAEMDRMLQIIESFS